MKTFCKLLILVCSFFFLSNVNAQCPISGVGTGEAACSKTGDCTTTVTLCYSTSTEVPAVGSNHIINKYNAVVTVVSGNCATFSITFPQAGTAPTSPYTLNSCAAVSAPICPTSVSENKDGSVTFCFANESDAKTAISNGSATINGVEVKFASYTSLCVTTTTVTKATTYAWNNCAALAPAAAPVCPSSVTANADGTLTICYSGEAAVKSKTLVIDGVTVTAVNTGTNCYTTTTATAYPSTIDGCAIAPQATCPITGQGSGTVSCAVKEGGSGNCSTNITLCYASAKEIPAVGTTHTLNGYTATVKSISGNCAVFTATWPSTSPAPTSPYTLNSCAAVSAPICPTSVTENADGSVTFCFASESDVKVATEKGSATINGVEVKFASISGLCVTTGVVTKATTYTWNDCAALTPPACPTSVTANADGTLTICYSGEAAVKSKTLVIDGVTVTAVNSGTNCYTTTTATAYPSTIDGCDIAPQTACPSSVTTNADGTVTFCFDSKAAVVKEIKVDGAMYGASYSADGMCVTTTVAVKKKEGFAAGTVYVYGDCPAITELPVDIISFNGNYQARTHSVDVKWEVASEYNVNRYELERSIDGVKFQKIYTETNVLNTSERHSYSYTDKLERATSKVFYRLKNVDNDGTFEYTKTVALKAGKSTAINVYPNPTKAVLNVQVPGAGKVVIFDLFGRNVIDQNIQEGNNVQAIEISHLPQGNYIAQFTTTTGETLEAKKFTVIK